MNQTLALAILDAGHSVFLTGPAGSGKTHTLNQFVKQSRSAGKTVAVTASTGLAATHLCGNTIHSWAGIGIADELHKHTVRDMSKSRQDKIIDTDILIIDEVSMLHDFRLDMIDQVCRQVRGEDVPFGGIQVVLSGDLFQLPPINRQEAREGSFVTSSMAWSDLSPTICYLSEQHRQDDDQLLEILTALRQNDIRRRHAEALLARKTARTPFDEPVTELYTRNVDVDRINQQKLDAMTGETHEFHMSTSGRKGAAEALKKSCLAPETLQLKKGAFVMFVKNAQDKKYVNGTLGTVLDFDKETGYPVVQINNGRKVLAEPSEWEMRDGNKKIAGLEQIPLRLAWAITVHKSQGMTLDGAHVDLGSAFVPGMGYVALSRVKKLSTLTLAGLNKMALQMHPEAYELDSVLQGSSKNHAEKYLHLEKPYLEKQKLHKKEAKNSKVVSWQAKIDKMRQTHPNAYKSWKPLEDKTLLDLWTDGKSVKQLGKKLGRHDGSIRARLKKHLGEDLFSSASVKNKPSKS